MMLTIWEIDDTHCKMEWEFTSFCMIVFWIIKKWLFVLQEMDISTCLYKC